MEQLVDEAQKAYARELFERAVRNKKAVAWWRGAPISDEQAAARVVAEVVAERRRALALALPEGKVLR
ncbi:hypothetical protein [Mycobacterium phage Y10]|uniref:Uncharacterized protein n=1 Tax=Mycobacterium phage Y10 TaxID=2072010 RepID=A0A2Z5XBA8_9CAUD|nr:hypothetical protein PBI_JF1_79 [Mycobacterium phage JF1]BBC43364.1 hypothetical protein [Mycobacterium phage Y10]BBC43455.1 hypothetical protein [Mycobacterium phage Y2]BBC43546.1 hypothetical protein [Mycobacterium phage Y10]